MEEVNHRCNREGYNLNVGHQYVKILVNSEREYVCWVEDQMMNKGPEKWTNDELYYLRQQKQLNEC